MNFKLLYACLQYENSLRIQLLQFIKKIAPVKWDPQEHIFNLSLMKGEVPKGWVQSIVTSIPKKTPLDVTGNFRPVSITSTFARLFEKF